MLVTETSNAGSSSRDKWVEDEENPEESLENVVGALVIKSQSQNKMVKRILGSEEMVYQPDKRKRETFYRNNSKRLREGMRKIGVYVRCYGILFLHRYVFIRPSTDYVGM